VQCVV